MTHWDGIKSGLCSRASQTQNKNLATTGWYRGEFRSGLCTSETQSPYTGRYWAEVQHILSTLDGTDMNSRAGYARVNHNLTTLDETKLDSKVGNALGNHNPLATELHLRRTCERSTLREKSKVMKSTLAVTTTTWYIHTGITYCFKMFAESKIKKNNNKTGFRNGQCSSEITISQ